MTILYTAKVKLLFLKDFLVPHSQENHNEIKYIQT